MTEYWLPPQSSGEIVPLEALAAAPVRAGIAHWHALKGSRACPARGELKSRDLGALADNLILVKVLEDGDYQYVQVGAALVPGFGEDFSGRILSAITADAPGLGLGLRMLYEKVRRAGAPLGYRGWVGGDMRGAAFAYHENALLPFGPGPGAVDHILIASAIVLRPGA